MVSEYRAFWENKMWEVMQIDYRTPQTVILTDRETDHINVPLKDVILMMNTGRTDIAGECVYEGDFIESHLGGKVLDVIMLVKYGTYQTCCPADDCYMDNIGFYVEAEGYPQMPLGPLEEYAKVIGNLHETPELIFKHNKTGLFLGSNDDVFSNMLLKMKNDGYDELRKQYNKIMFKELKKSLESAPASNNNAPEGHMYPNCKLLSLRRTANFSYRVQKDDIELTEKEKSVLISLLHPNLIHEIVILLLNGLSDEEIEALYNKMDSIIKNEGINRRALGEYDEMYVVEFLCVKEILHKECINRQLDVSKNQNMEYQLWVE